MVVAIIGIDIKFFDLLKTMICRIFVFMNVTTVGYTNEMKNGEKRLSILKLSIVIPAYNEADNLPLILKRFAEVIKRDDVEVIIVDNGSTDESAEVLSRLLPKHSFARSVRVEANQGYGFGILQGLKAAAGDYIGWTHADMQTDPQDVIKALNLIEVQDSPDNIMVKGDRHGRSLVDNFFTVGMGLFESLYLGKWLYEINAQPNIFSREFFSTWKNPPYDFALDLYVLYLAKQQGMNILRFPVEFPDRMHGESKWNTGLLGKWKFIKRTIDFSMKLKKGGIS